MSPQDQAKLRPSNYLELSSHEQWDIDKELGILDWDGVTTKKGRDLRVGDRVVLGSGKVFAIDWVAQSSRPNHVHIGYADLTYSVFDNDEDVPIEMLDTKTTSTPVKEHDR